MSAGSARIKDLKGRVRKLPDAPGVYQYFDKHGKILYVGKAKNLKKRVGSYFSKSHAYGKIKYLVQSIADIQFIVVETELDALLLENNLIKKYQPRYNAMLKDDKTYPWICIKNERFPRIFPTRTLVKDGSQYFGPYPSGRTMHTLLDLIKKLYPLRNCSYVLSTENISKKKFKVCLEYHVKNCLGPCENKQTEEQYEQGIDHIKQILKGNISTVIKEMKDLMWKCSEAFDFETAQSLKEKLASLERYQSRSVIVNPNITDVDVFSILADEKEAFVNYLKIVNGAVVHAQTTEVKKKLDESQEELLLLAIPELRKRFNSEAKEILLPFQVDYSFKDIEITVPKIGDKKKLLELSERNAGYFKKEKLSKESLKLPPADRILSTVQSDLRLKELPSHIECFDNSNIQGSWPVAACVVFRNARPAKKEYRLFNIKTVEGPDDYASMEEVIYRRYKRLTEENKSMPQLIVIDGGKGQLQAALNSLEKLSLQGKVAIIGIAKKLEEIYFPGDPLPIYINKKSETLKLIQQLRDEAHRFGLKHHRNRRSKSFAGSSLVSIKGISEKTAEKLLQQFKSVKKIYAAGESKVAKVIGPSKAKKIFEAKASK